MIRFRLEAVEFLFDDTDVVEIPTAFKLVIRGAILRKGIRQEDKDGGHSNVEFYYLDYDDSLKKLYTEDVKMIDLELIPLYEQDKDGEFTTIENP